MFKFKFLFLGVVGVGGVAWDFGGYKGLSYIVNLKEKTNNEAKSKSLLVKLQLSIQTCNDIIVICESKILIELLVKDNLAK